MSEEWQPVRPAHSIECVATVLTYNEPLTEHLVKRVLRQAERLALQEGLSDRSDVRSLQFALAPDQVHAARTQVEGLAFQRSGHQTQAGRLLLEDLVVSRNELVYRSFDYVRWSDYLQKINALMLPLAELSAAGTAMRSLRLEYQDRFIPRDRSKYRIDQLLVPHQMIAEHIFETDDLWHSHSGKMLTVDDDKMLVHLNVDLVSGETMGPAPQEILSVGIMTAFERRYGKNKLDVESAVIKSIAGHLGDLHSRSKDLFRSILAPQVAERVGLGESVVH
ncbi:hypothetical protein GOC91_28970 [Sinorhizobium medicae]|nr:hypothetical protein [Sinorhizobium medicae]MDX0882845.1 hypothetical protein [Sinorhizobium medicae]